MELPHYSIVVCCDEKDGISKNGNIPWKNPEELKYFSDLTSATLDSGKTNVVMMGRKTWESIPIKNRPLSNRINCILSRSSKVDGIDCFPDIYSALYNYGSKPEIEAIFIIGGESIYNQCLSEPLCGLCDYVYLSRLKNDHNCDQKFPMNTLNDKFTLEDSVDSPHDFTCEMWTRHQLLFEEEYQYLNLIRKILKKGERRTNRTGVDTLSVFGEQLRFDLRKHFPLLTTKKVFWRGVVEELLWMLRGETDARDLQGRGVHIWDGNSSREFLDNLGFEDREEGDCGPIYGWQWRRFDEYYFGAEKLQGFGSHGTDQIKKIVSLLKKEPKSRRIVLTAWNPAQIGEMVLPPCHMMSVFQVSNNEELSCHMLMRSTDVTLGLPFNIASYALLTHILAKMTNLKVGSLVISLSDAHIYTNHLEAIKKQLDRIPRKMPQLSINIDRSDAAEYVFTDFDLENYSPHPTIKMDMVA